MIQLKHLKLLIHEIILWYTADGFITMAEKISDQKLLGNWNVSNYQFSLKYSKCSGTCDAEHCALLPAGADSHISTDQLEVLRLSGDSVALCWQAVPVSHSCLQSDQCVLAIQRLADSSLQAYWHAQDYLTDSAHPAPSCLSDDTTPPYFTFVSPLFNDNNAHYKCTHIFS